MAESAQIASTRAGSWRCIGVSVTGVRHKEKGQPCQDAFGCHHLPTGALVVAVADGAGSAPLAQAGAQLVVAGAVDAVQQAWARYRPASRKAWRDLIEHAFQMAQQKVLLTAAAAEEAPRNYAATLLVAVVSEEMVACGLVGDCALVVQTEGGAYLSLCEPQRGEYANTTYFATHHDLAERLDVQLLAQPIQRLALFSDGLLNLALNLAENRPYAPFFDPLFAFAQEAVEPAQAADELAIFLDSERVNQRTRDDKTLLLLTR